MNGFHAHVHVIDLDANIRFYSQLFGTEPSVVKPDYAKWMLDEPRLNFAISNPHDGKAPGVAHLGLQVDNHEDLERIGTRLKQADALALAETGATCCYARSDKYWAEDPQGLQWESFHSDGDATTYYAPEAAETSSKTACGASRCGPAPAKANATACCG